MQFSLSYHVKNTHRTSIKTKWKNQASSPNIFEKGDICTKKLWRKWLVVFFKNFTLKSIANDVGWISRSGVTIYRGTYGYAPQLLLSVAATPLAPKQSFIVYESLCSKIALHIGCCIKVIVPISRSGHGTPFFTPRIVVGVHSIDCVVIGRSTDQRRRRRAWNCNTTTPVWWCI